MATMRMRGTGGRGRERRLDGRRRRGARRTRAPLSALPASASSRPRHGTRYGMSEVSLIFGWGGEASDLKFPNAFKTSGIAHLCT